MLPLSWRGPVIIICYWFQLDTAMLPHSWRGPVHTPAMEDYEAPDGEYTETTRRFDDKPIGTIRL